MIRVAKMAMLTAALATAVAVAAPTTEAQAGHWHNNGGVAVAAGVAGLAAGVLLGSALNAPANGPYGPVVGPAPAPPPVVYAPAYAPVYAPPPPPPAPVYAPVYAEAAAPAPWSPAWYNYCSARYRSSTRTTAPISASTAINTSAIRRFRATERPPGVSLTPRAAKMRRNGNAHRSGSLTKRSGFCPMPPNSGRIVRP